MPKLRSKGERVKVILDLSKKLKDLFQLDLAQEDIPALVQLKKIFRDYVNQNDDEPKKMVSFSGKIPFHEIDRIIHYCLPIKRMNEPYMILKRSNEVTK